MCPSCHPQLFSRRRKGTFHISPRFGSCTRWQVALDDKVAGNVYEAEAGDKGAVWYTEDGACECHSGYPSLAFAAGCVELFHEPHQVKVEFDDGSYVIVTCPEMHLGPYNVYKAPTPAGAEVPALDALMQGLQEMRDTLRTAAAEHVQEPEDQRAPEEP